MLEHTSIFQFLAAVRKLLNFLDDFSSSKVMATPLEECCGLGCNNCIMDRFLDKSARSSESKFNLFNQKNYQKFRVKALTKERPFIYQFTFELVCERPEPYQKDEQLIAPPVSYLMLRAPRNCNQKSNPLFDDYKEFLDPPKDDEDDVIYYRSQPQQYDKGTPEIYISRKYTPFEVDEELRTFKIIVKLEKYGKMSKYFTKLHVGNVCEFKGPFEAFNYTHEKIENYIVFTQGISIVSAFRLVKEIIYESAQSRILLVACFKNLNETFLREDFFKLTHFWCLKHHTFLSENVTPEVPLRSGEKIHTERLTSQNFKELVRDLKFFDPSRTQVLVSGRERFIETVKSIAAENRYKNVETI